MEVRNVGKNDRTERSADLPQRPPVVLVPAPRQVRDAATISAASRKQAAEIEALTARARTAGGDRGAVVAEARRKLAAGELDAAPVAGETAKRLLDAGFESV